jgi:hypothetical protein
MNCKYDESGASFARNPRWLKRIFAGTFAALLFAGPAWAGTKFGVKNIHGNYSCAVNGDDDFETSVILFNGDGKGNVTASKTHISTDFESGCGSTFECICNYTGSTTVTVNSDGTGLLTWSWAATNGNPGGCSSGQDDTWAIALGSGGKSFFVASANNGFEEEPAVGQCLFNP